MPVRKHGCLGGRGLPPRQTQKWNGAYIGLKTAWVVVLHHLSHRISVLSAQSSGMVRGERGRGIFWSRGMIFWGRCTVFWGRCVVFWGRGVIFGGRGVIFGRWGGVSGFGGMV